jgi:hypothetical protein
MKTFYANKTKTLPETKSLQDLAEGTSGADPAKPGEECAQLPGTGLAVLSASGRVTVTLPLQETTVTDTTWPPHVQSAAVLVWGLAARMRAAACLSGLAGGRIARPAARRCRRSGLGVADEWGGMAGGSMQVFSGSAGCGGLCSVLLGVAEVGDGFGERGQADDEHDRGQRSVPGCAGKRRQQPGGVAEVVPGRGGRGNGLTEAGEEFLLADCGRGSGGDVFSQRAPDTSTWITPSGRVHTTTSTAYDL